MATKPMETEVQEIGTKQHGGFRPTRYPKIVITDETHEPLPDFTLKRSYSVRLLETLTERAKLLKPLQYIKLTNVSAHIRTKIQKELGKKYRVEFQKTDKNVCTVWIIQSDID